MKTTLAPGVYRACWSMTKPDSSLLVCAATSWVLFASVLLISPENANGNTVNLIHSLLKRRFFCPSVKYFLKQNSTETTVVPFLNCSNEFPGFTAHQGLVYSFCEDYGAVCYVHIKPPRGMFVRASLQRLEYWCHSNQWQLGLVLYEGPVFGTFHMKCNLHSLGEIVLESTENSLRIGHFDYPPYEIDIEAIQSHKVILKYNLNHSGYVIVPYALVVHNYVDELKILTKSAIILNVQCANMVISHLKLSCIEDLQIISRKPSSSKQTDIHLFTENDKSAQMFLTPIQIRYTFQWRFRSLLSIIFSVLSETTLLKQSVNDLFNCSVDYYYKFRHVFECNMNQDCYDGRDEGGHCPFSSSDCQGMVASHNKCFKLLRLDETLLFMHADMECQKTGGQVGSVKTRKEQEDVLHLFKQDNVFTVFTGFFSGWYEVPFQYSKLSKWADGTIIYHLNHFTFAHAFPTTRAVGSCDLDSMEFWCKHSLLESLTGSILCEMRLQTEVISSRSIVASLLQSCDFTLTQSKMTLSVCPHGQIAHEFTFCDPYSRCRKEAYSKISVPLNMNEQNNRTFVFVEKMAACLQALFRCEDGNTIPYTVVCDFRHDCPDGRDESFCQHPFCGGFQCSNGQCIAISQRCNEYSDCVDDSDEVSCTEDQTYISQAANPDNNQTFLINLDGSGYFILKLIQTNDSCPITHYSCTYEAFYCLPVYTRCNGFGDCIYGEDEQHCQRVSCPGLYQCRGSSVCVHGDHLCDGWGQCPQRDDELTCSMSCPELCQCQGHSFRCTKPFPAYLYPQLRYGDVTGSGMRLAEFSQNRYLVSLDLSHCSIVNISDIEFPNLEFIDLSSNDLQTLDLSFFFQLTRLKALILADNPIRTNEHKSFQFVHYALEKVDVSQTHIDILSGVFLPVVKFLNLSFSKINNIHPRGFKSMPHLSRLDLRGNPLHVFPSDLLSGLTDLKTVLSSNYRLCCETLLPAQRSKITCMSPRPALRSCTSLLPSEVHSVWLWLVCTVAILGNLLCFTVHQPAHAIFGVYLNTMAKHLQCANFLMGISMAIVLVANEILDGKYVQFERLWRDSLLCKLASFLSLLSCQVSTWSTGLLSAYHIRMLSGPVSACTDHNRMMHTMCAGVWFVGFFFSLVPFLPGLSHLGLRAQSGLCRLALFDHLDSGFKWFTLTVVCHFMLCAMIVCGLLFIILRISKHQMVIDATKRSLYTSVWLLFKMALTETGCWFFIGVTLLMAGSSDHSSYRIYGNTVVFLLPVGSALNPQLYIWTLINQRRLRSQEESLIQFVKSRHALIYKGTATS